MGIVEVIIVHRVEDSDDAKKKISEKAKWQQGEGTTLPSLQGNRMDRRFRRRDRSVWLQRNNPGQSIAIGAEAQSGKMMWSKQKIFCNACGKEMLTELPRVIGRNFKVCSSACCREMNWRETLSIMGLEYYPDPELKVSDSGIK